MGSRDSSGVVGDGVFIRMVQMTEPIQQPRQCLHEDYRLVRRTVADGSVHFGRQCKRCGGGWTPVPKASLTADQVAALVEYQAAQAMTGAQREHDIALFFREIEGAPNLVPSPAPGGGDEPSDDGPVHRPESISSVYDAYIASPEWQRLRLHALERDQHLCQSCRQCPAVDVHHLHYPPPDRYGDEPIYWLISVCRICHKRIHELRKAPKATGA